MSTPQLEVAEIFRRYGSSYLARYGKVISEEQRWVLKNILSCRTAALGGHVKKCDTCDHKEVYYNSCRDRHCPKCQAAARAEWLDKRAADLLQGVQYFHVVFTISDNLNSLVLQNRALLYSILFRSASETLHTIAWDQKHLGAELGFLAVLHTWSQSVMLHPHIHCVVPGGGISPNGDRWVSCRYNYFLPVEVLSALFQKKFLSYLKKAFKTGKLSLHGKLEHLKEENRWKPFVSALYDTKWVVYAKPPFADAERVLKYLARYTHRVAISNQRLISLKDGKVTFWWKDYAHGNVKRPMTIDAVEFIRRFLLHVLPTGFMRIRHYGFLSNRSRKDKLALCRQLLTNAGAPQSASKGLEEKTDPCLDIDDSARCPECKEGHMIVVQTNKPYSKSALKLSSLLFDDTG